MKWCVHEGGAWTDGCRVAAVGALRLVAPLKKGH